MGQMYDATAREAEEAMTPERRDAIEAAATLIAEVSNLARWELAEVLCRAQGGSPWAPEFEVAQRVMAGPNADQERETTMQARREERAAAALHIARTPFA